jgi:shikimate kinase
MLILQGAKAFEIWTNRKPDIESMKLGFQSSLLPKTNIALLGFMGTGKSTVGKLLAKRLGKQFIDTDTEIEKMAGMKIADIFDRYGEKRFRSLEKEAVGASSSESNTVLSCGGGVVLDIVNIARLHKTCRLFLLSASSEEVEKRLRKEKNRPLLGNTPEEKLKKIRELLEKRKPFYTASGAEEISTDGLTPEEVTEKIIGVLTA